MSDQSPEKPQIRGPGRLSAAETALLPERLLDAAETVFLADGFARATVEAIAAAAGASRKTIYARYANKTEILAAVIDRMVRGQQQATPDETTEADDLADPRKALAKLAVEMALLVDAPKSIALDRLILAEADQAPELARLFLDQHGKAEDIVAARLNALSAQGLLPLMPDVRLASILFLEMAASLPRLRALIGRRMRRDEIEVLTSAGVEIFLRGCGYDPARAF